MYLRYHKLRLMHRFPPTVALDKLPLRMNIEARPLEQSAALQVLLKS